MKKILTKMLLGGLMVCAGGIMHAAAAKPNFFAITPGDFRDMSKDEQDKHICSVTSDELDNESQEQRDRYIDALIEHVDGNENNALIYVQEHALDAACHYLMIKIGGKFDAAWDCYSDNPGLDDLADAMGGCWIEGQPESVIQSVANSFDLENKMKECRIESQRESVVSSFDLENKMKECRIESQRECVTQAIDLANKMRECRIDGQRESVTESVVPSNQGVIEEAHEVRKEKRKHDDEDLRRAKRAKFKNAQGKVACASAESTVRIDGQPELGVEFYQEAQEQRKGKHKHGDEDLRRAKRARFNKDEDTVVSVSAEITAWKAGNAREQVALADAASQSQKLIAPLKKRSLMQKAHVVSGNSSNKNKEKK